MELFVIMARGVLGLQFGLDDKVTAHWAQFVI